LAEWEAAGHSLAPFKDKASAGSPVQALTISEVILPYWSHVETYYRHPDGTTTTEANNIRLAMRRLRTLYGHTLAADFDALALETLRIEMIKERLARTRINRDMARVKRLFKWAANRKLAPLGVYQSLQTMEGLRAGRSEAIEPEPVRPVAEEVVQATLPFLRPQIAAMADLQLLTGMRPGEVVILRGIDLETSGSVWTYRPGSDQGRHGRHKTAYRGHQRTVLIGPRAQKVLRPWLRLNLEEYLFQPREARAQWEAEKRKNRKSKVPPSQQNRRKANPKRRPGDHYNVSSYDQAVAKAVRAANVARLCDDCKEAHREKRKLCGLCPEIQACDTCLPKMLPHWHPHQLRHAKATEIRREAGLDAARAVLGHRSPVITEQYAEIDAAKAAAVMERLG
jgi:integrase